MANLVRLCGVFNKCSPKSLTNWKSFSNVVQNSVKKSVFSKVNSNVKQPLTLCQKISIGITTSVIVKALGDNLVFCSSKKPKGSRAVGFAPSKIEEPEFNWKKFYEFVLPYWPELLGAVLAAVACALLNIEIPRALGHLVDILTKVAADSSSSFTNAFFGPATHMLCYYSLQSIFTFFYISLLAHVGEGVAKTMRMNLFCSIMDQDIAFFDSHRTGDLLNRLTVDVHDFKSSFKMIASQGLRNITQIVGCSVSLFFISPAMTGAMMIVVPTVIMIGTIFGSFLREISLSAKDQAGKVTLLTEEALSNIRTVRAFAMEDLEKKMVDEQTEIYKNLNTRLGYGIGLFQAGTNLFLNGLVLGTVFLGGYMVNSGNLSCGDLMAFLVSLQILQRSFSQMSLLFGVYIKGKHAGARVFELIDLPPGQTIRGGKIIPYHSLIPNVRYENVAFAYPTRPYKQVLNEINLDIPEGKTVAIVGSSGSGKSTLAWLLERFYDVSGGAIYINGENIRNLNSKWLRRNVIGFISQEPILFATTVMENIRYGKPNATDEEVRQAAKLANADEFINEFPDGYETMVGERGASVSGGQKQRIAIARALLKDPAILILDEATSALDSESEKAVQKALDSITKFRTTIIIAHRLSTIKNADFIVVLDNGVVVESGTHKELIDKNGMYAALVNQQMDKNNKDD